MLRPISLGVILAIAGSTWLGAQRGTPPRTTPRPTPAPAPAKPGISATCAADLGTGVKTKRQFCDAVIARTAAQSIAITMLPHTGVATLHFDLHNRFSTGAPDAKPRDLFASHVAVVHVIRPTGAVIDRAAVVSEFRRVADALDRLPADPGSTGFKTVVPGRGVPVKVTIPAGVNAVGIVGVRLESTTLSGGVEKFDAPGRPVAMISNLRIDYVPVK